MLDWLFEKKDRSLILNNKRQSPFIVVQIEILDLDYAESSLLRIIIAAYDASSFDRLLRRVNKAGFTKFELDHSDKTYNRFVHDCTEEEICKLIESVLVFDLVNPVLMMQYKEAANIEVSFPSLKEIVIHFIKTHETLSNTKNLSIPTELQDLIRLEQPNADSASEDTMPEVTYTCKYF